MESEGETDFTDKYPLPFIRQLILASLQRIEDNEEKISADNRQKILAAFGVTQRGSAKRVRYDIAPKALQPFSTTIRQRDSIGVSALRRQDATIFWDDNSSNLSNEDTRLVLQEVLDDKGLRCSAWEHVENAYHFKTPLNLVFADHKPERAFIRHLVAPENATVIDAWIKSTDSSFYPIEYAWRKGEHPKRGFFNPDFFIKKENHIQVVEIKGDEEITDPSDENKGKYRAAQEHFKTLNDQQSESIYHFYFLTPTDYDAFFKFIREGKYTFISQLQTSLESAGE
jgi:type III restriction enzyme